MRDELIWHTIFLTNQRRFISVFVHINEMTKIA